MTLEEIEKDYGETLDKLTSLAEQKVKLQSELVLGSLEEGKYYFADIGMCTNLYFKYTKDTVHIQDMKGTVGYNGWNSILFSRCFEVTLTRTSSKHCVCFNKYISLQTRIKFEEITEELFNEVRQRIIEYTTWE